MVARVRGERVREDLAALVDRECFRAGCADVDAEVDAHWWGFGSVGRKRLLYVLVCEREKQREAETKRLDEIHMLFLSPCLVVFLSPVAIGMACNLVDWLPAR